MTRPQAALALWNISRRTGRGLEVDRGPADDMKAEAAKRNEFVCRVGASDIVFVAIPPGRRPKQDDIPPAPEKSEPEQPRTLGLLQAQATTPRDAELVADAYDLAEHMTREESRKALGAAWSAYLREIPASFWKYLKHDDPELHRRLCEALGVKIG